MQLLKDHSYSLKNPSFNKMVHDWATSKMRPYRYFWRDKKDKEPIEAQMLAASKVLVAFVNDDKDWAVQDMIETAEEKGLKVKVFNSK